MRRVRVVDRERPVVRPRVEVVRAAVDLPADAGPEQPAVGSPERPSTDQQLRVEQRVREAPTADGVGDEVCRFGLRRRPGPVLRVVDRPAQQAEPRCAPASTSIRSASAVQTPSWTAPSTTARAERWSVDRRAASATARTGSAHGVPCQDQVAGGRVVSWTVSQSVQRTRPPAGTRTSTEASWGA